MRTAKTPASLASILWTNRQEMGLRGVGANRLKLGCFLGVSVSPCRK